MISKKKIVISYIATAVLLFALFLISVNTGSLKVTPSELFKGLFVEYDKTVATIYDLRFPRIFIAMLGGAAMAVSGVLLQAVIGPISFLGLIVPHIARLLVGSNHKLLIPYSMILGAFVFLLADTIGRTIASPYEISASIIMSVIGGPFFIILLRRSDRKNG